MYVCDGNRTQHLLEHVAPAATDGVFLFLPTHVCTVRGVFLLPLVAFFFMRLSPVTTEKHNKPETTPTGANTPLR